MAVKTDFYDLSSEVLIKATTQLIFRRRTNMNNDLSHQDQRRRESSGFVIAQVFL